MRRELVSKLVDEVLSYVERLEKEYSLTDSEVVAILEAVKEEYEWED